jgi:2,5-diamino-6-(ribosylamino)-4(3H)-pyrimidinone 5'-phosphate reductase
MPRPYILVNVAMSLDGKIDTAARRGAAISPAADKARVDRLRAAVDAVLVGGRTLLDEDPKLTVRSPALRAERRGLGQPENPARVGLVSVADLDPAGDFMTAGHARRLIYTTARTAPGQIDRLRAAGAEVFVLGGKRPDPAAALESLYRLGMRRLLVEGGGTILAEFFRLGLADEVSVYVAPRIFGGASAPTLADGPGWSIEQAPRLQCISAEKFDEDGGVLLRYLVRRE